MAKPKFTVTMQHDEDSLVALSHMQYDLFCTRNRIARNAVAVLVIVIAVLYGGGSWWSLLLIALCVVGILSPIFMAKMEKKAETDAVADTNVDIEKLTEEDLV